MSVGKMTCVTTNLGHFCYTGLWVRVPNLSSVSYGPKLAEVFLEVTSSRYPSRRVVSGLDGPDCLLVDEAKPEPIEIKVT